MQQTNRASGIEVDPARVRRARIEAGLTLADVAGSEVSRTMIHFVETGRSRPSKRVLSLIAKRTRKTPRYFMRRDRRDSRDDEDVASELSAAALRLKRFMKNRQVGEGEREALQFAEVALRHAASLTRSMQSRRRT